MKFEQILPPSSVAHNKFYLNQSQEKLSWWWNPSFKGTVNYCSTALVLIISKWLIPQVLFHEQLKHNALHTNLVIYSRPIFLQNLYIYCNTNYRTRLRHNLDIRQCRHTHILPPGRPCVRNTVEITGLGQTAKHYLQYKHSPSRAL